MKQLTLELLFQLFGISAASGLIYNDDTIHVISDDSTYLYHYDMNNEVLTKTPLSDYYYGRENINKEIKPDFEAITQTATNYYIFGSGSKQNRIDLVEIHKLTNDVISIQQLDILYESMKSFAQIDDTDFNIEGVIYDEGIWYFFNRGNGPQHKNGIFIVEGESIIDNFRITFIPIKLPKLNKVQTSFTDAIKVDDYFYFLAAAENSNSNYADGNIEGSIIGRIKIKNLKLDKVKTISTSNKFEGITLYKNNNDLLEFLLCEDPDDPNKNTGIYKLSFKK